MEAQQRVFFDFLKFCIGATSSIPETLGRADWRALYAMAMKQALMGVLFHGIRQLPKDLAPDTALLMQWMGVAQKIRQQNARLFADSARVAKRFGREGFRSCILKGQGNALLYPDPYMRTPGDIDIYVAGGRRRVMRYVDSVCPGQVMRYHHVDFPVMATAIEVHFTPSYMFFPLHNRRMQRWFGGVMDLQCSNRVALPDGYGEISVPTRSFNAIYILSHLYRHVFTEGIGLRQLLDYFYVLKGLPQITLTFSNTENSERTDVACSAKEKYHTDFSFLNTNITNNACSAIQSAELKRKQRSTAEGKVNLNGTITSDASFSNTENTEHTECRLPGDKNIQSAELKRNLNGTITSDASFSNTNITNNTNNACSADMNIQSAELKRKQRSTAEGKANEGDSPSVKSAGEKMNRQSAGDKDYPLRRELEHLGLWKFAGAVMWVMHEVFGLAENQMIAPMNEKEGRFLLDEVIRGGNFGQYDDRLGDKAGEGKLHRYFRMTLRNLRFVKHYPTEALSEPLFRTGFAVWKKMRGLR